MTSGVSTTEHRRALRAEGACLLLIACGLGAAVYFALYALGAALIAGGVAGLVAVSAIYTHSRSSLKKAEAESQAAMRVAELSTPRQRVV